MSEKKSCCAPQNPTRRELLKGIAFGSSAGALAGFNMPVMAGQLLSEGAEPWRIPKDKKLDANWLHSLYQRGQATTYEGWQQQRFIGMPIGGIGTGTVYIGGDGKLWCWDIFNQHHEGVVPNDTPDRDYVNPRGSRLRERYGANYVYPQEQRSPWNFEQGFAVVVEQDGEHKRLTLDKHGFNNIRFAGQSPIAHINYSDDSTALSVELEAMTPFIPLDEDSSSYPATILNYTLKNTGTSELEVTLEGWSENPALAQHGHRNDSGLINKTFDFDSGVGVSLECQQQRPTPEGYPDINSLPDFGSLALLCLDEQSQAYASSFLLPKAQRKQQNISRSQSWSPSIGGIDRAITLAPNESKTISFILAWHFPNMRLNTETFTKNSEPTRFEQANHQRWYAAKFADAKAVALDVANRFNELTQSTRLWQQTWYDSTLPHWLLERTMIPNNALQTNTSYRFADGRFWAWEGVGCCPGTCTHVWHYAQSVGRLFPALEQDLRERTDYGLALQKDGAIFFRGEYNDKDAVDGQAGVILRTYREHQMTADDSFVKRLWPKIKLALQYLILQDARDGIPNGIPSGKQHNTLDADWFGKVPALASMYLAALKAGSAMAVIAGDTDFAHYCNNIGNLGQHNIANLFDADKGFFIQQEDIEHLDAIGTGTGCYIDQVIGQWWSFQLGLGRLFDGEKTRKALNALWQYNFCPDIGQLRDSIDNPRLRGRPYALAGDAGMVMCTWPKGGKKENWEKYWQFGYFNECMTGFEYQVASHMIWESDNEVELLEKGLVLTRSVHDRYHGSMRNPYNEIECSDHYARAMASYSVFLAVCGFEYDGPKGLLGFKPRLTDRSENKNHFRAAFTAAQSWGQFQQTVAKHKAKIVLEVAYGELLLNALTLRLFDLTNKAKIEVLNSTNTAMIDWQNNTHNDASVSFSKPIILKAGEKLELVFS